MTDMMEEWRDMPGFPHYSVSSLGRIRRTRPDTYGRTSDRCLALVPHSAGYLQVSLHNSGKQSVCLVHRLVCEAFHGPAPSPGHHAAHGDGCKTNNCAANLRWASPTENNADKLRHGTLISGDAHPARRTPEILPRGSAHRNSKLTELQVLAIRRDERPQSQIAADYGVTQSLISGVKRFKSWTHVQKESPNV
ncbi:MAG: NUMOD4 motif-containing HNH endonuclease [Alphaproteobacteria bacterium]